MTIAEAILALRKAQSLTQMGLANRLHTSLTAIHNYEVGRIPEPGVLMRLKQVAEDADQPELAALFRDQLYKDMGVPDSWEGMLAFEPKNDLEKILVAGLLEAFRNQLLTHCRPPLLDALHEPCQRVHEKIRNQKLRDQVRRILRKFIKLRIAADGRGYGDKKGKRLV